MQTFIELEPKDFKCVLTSEGGRYTLYLLDF